MIYMCVYTSMSYEPLGPSVTTHIKHVNKSESLQPGKKKKRRRLGSDSANCLPRSDGEPNSLFLFNVSDAISQQ